MVECKGPETTREIKESMNTRSEVKPRMTGGSGNKEREREGEERNEWKLW